MSSTTSSIVNLAHKLRVMAIYRGGLKQLRYWSKQRDSWFPRARALRHEMESNMGVTDRDEIERLCSHAEFLIKDNAHPEPILPVYLSTQYSVNPPMPERIKYLLNYNKDW